MKTTRFSLLSILAAVAAIAAFLVARFLISRGLPLPEMPRSMLVSLPSIAVVLAFLGYPIFKYRRALRARAEADAASEKGSARPKRPDSFYAVRVLLLAKAAALAGALFFGWLVGLILVQLSAPVPVFERAGGNLFGLGGAALMIVVALLVERACRLPEDTDTPDNAAAA